MQQEEPLVSVAMATYNGAAFLAEQIESIVGQTYPSVEIVIADDASTDDTVSIVKAFQERYSFIYLLRNENNCGVTKTFENAVRHCRGEYVALCDQDDLWVPEKLATLVEAIGDHDAAYADSLLIDESGRSLNITFKSMMNLRSYYSGVPFLLSNTIAGHSLLVRTSFLQSILPFPAHLYFDLWIAFNAAAGRGVTYVDKPLVLYRQHTTNTVGTRHSGGRRKKESAKQQFLEKKAILETLAGASVKDQKTKKILQQMLLHFHRRWSLRRSVFFFRNFQQLLVTKQKPYYRKVLYCLKMFFKPNY